MGLKETTARQVRFPNSKWRWWCISLLTLLLFKYKHISSSIRSTTFSTEVPCPAGKKTDNPQGYCCVFPFEYGGVTYHSCTKVAHSREWCSLTPVYSGKWANCGKETHMMFNLYFITFTLIVTSKVLLPKFSCFKHLFRYSHREIYIARKACMIKDYHIRFINLLQTCLKSSTSIWVFLRHSCLQ